jgi:hypothetical protein
MHVGHKRGRQVAQGRTSVLPGKGREDVARGGGVWIRSMGWPTSRYGALNQRDIIRAGVT